MIPTPPDKTYQVQGFLIKETDKAVLIKVHLVDDEPPKVVADHWFPKSQLVDSITCEDPEDLTTMDSFVFKAWIMEQRGLV
jgi:hypothetical protein